MQQSVVEKHFLVEEARKNPHVSDSEKKTLALLICMQMDHW